MVRLRHPSNTAANGEGEDISGVVLIREERMRQIRAAWRRSVGRNEYPDQSLVVLEAQQTRIPQFPPDEDDD
ncbi:hypothetical protein [Salinibacter ruber]|uniref:hypothetical protein n=1 Tax=Salinibacter ruber TaxID=146919 RepID=UPI0021686DA0|nr:hypothetical protein [Salinibacter ruber]MCS4142571.1 hypothetical protein [Salinibacter ruber]